MILGKLSQMIENNPLMRARRHLERKWAAHEVDKLKAGLLGKDACEHDLEVLVFTKTKITPDEWRALDVFQRRDWLQAIRDLGRKTPPADLGKEEKALAALVAHPGWSDAEIAKHVGCSRTSLYRWPRYVAAREALESGRYQRPKASDL